MTAKKKWVAFVAAIVLAFTVAPLALADASYSLYVVDPPISNQAILPGRPLPPICKQGKTIQVRACPGEYEPASFVVVTKQPLQSVRIEVDALSGPAGTLPKEVVDVRIARPTAPRFPKENIPGAVTVLLLKDDSMLTSEPDPIPEYPGQRKDVWPHGLRDARELLPVRIDELKQFWITVHVPADARPGSYSASLRVIPTNAPASELILRLEIYAFQLLPPKTEYSIYYPTTLVAEGSDDWRMEKGWNNTAWLPPKQYLLELENMVAHGVNNPFCYMAVADKPDGRLDFSGIEQVLALREKAGMVAGRPLYLWPSQRAEAVQKKLTNAEKSERARLIQEVMVWGRQHGYPDIYFYAIDEASGSAMSAERDSLQAIHDGGGKVFVACSSDFYDLIPDLLDQPVLLANTYDRGQSLYEKLSLTPHPAALPLADKAGRAKVKAEMEANYESWMSFADQRNDANLRGIIDGTHRRGNRIFTYMFPMAGAAVPEVHRRNYGLGLWQMGFDGCMTWAYAHIKGSVVSPNTELWCYVIRTEDGVIDKVEWEAFREGVDDARYLATLLDALGRTVGTYGRDPLVRETWNWLAGLDAATGDLNAIRAEMARRIVALKDMGEHKKSVTEIDPAKMRGAPKGEKWDVEFTGDDLPVDAKQGWTGSANAGQFSPNYPPGFLLANGNPGGGFNRPLAGYTKAAGWTVEWAMGVKAHWLTPGQLPSPQDVVVFNDDTSSLSVRYTKDSVILKDHTGANAATLALDFTGYHIYRLVRQPGSKTVELYVDNNAKPVLSITPAASNAGNLNSVGWGNSLFQAMWDFFRFHIGATVPTADPAAKAEQR